ncbi:unnamed protein product [Adineta ricciae]|uniref:G-protein coupled receptors family 1 profile domain-containing protein n=1 Tax=Adineta ricciae TaxID=249248 RepID=A0A815KH85_ADIRI|nr:unnamed protein product [Adineta ricciae]CAF1395588.1 unnamed protein product [Adineta ricciae]
MSYWNNSSSLIAEPWFIPFDVFMIVCLVFVILPNLIFLFIILLDRTCHTVPMILTANSCLAQVVLGSDLLIISGFTLYSDLKQIRGHYFLCTFAGYLTYVTCAVLNYSFLLQAFYRYVTVVYPTRVFWQRKRNQLLFVGVTWAYTLLFPLIFVFTGQIVYNADNQICQVPLKLSVSIIFVALSAYVIPIVMTVVIYWKLVHYVHEMNQLTTSVNRITRAQRELKMFRRTVTLLMILFVIDFPYALFILMSFFNRAPQCHFRIAYVFIDTALACVTVALFQFTDPLKQSIKKHLHL